MHTSIVIIDRLICFNQIFINKITSSTIYQEKKWNKSVNSKTKLNEYIQRELKKERPYPQKFDIAVPANTYCGDSTKVVEKLKL